MQGVKGCEAGDVSARSLQTESQPGSERIDYDLEHDREFGPDIEAAVELVRDGSLVEAVEAVTGPLR